MNVDLREKMAEELACNAGKYDSKEFKNAVKLLLGKDTPDSIVNLYSMAFRERNRELYDFLKNSKGAGGAESITINIVRKKKNAN